MHLTENAHSLFIGREFKIYLHTTYINLKEHIYYGIILMTQTVSQISVTYIININIFILAPASSTSQSVHKFILAPASSTSQSVNS